MLALKGRYDGRMVILDGKPPVPAFACPELAIRTRLLRFEEADRGKTVYIHGEQFLFSSATSVVFLSSFTFFILFRLIRLCGKNPS